MKIKDGFVVRKIAGVTYAVAVGERTRDFNGMVKLTGTGEFIWNELQRDTTLDGLVRRIAEVYDVDEKTARDDAEKFLAKLREANILE